MTPGELARQTFSSRLAANPYPGRGLVVGRAASGGAWLQVYWIMGRSEHSRNRAFVAEGGVLRTEPLDWEKVRDPSLIVYEAMLERGRQFLASNGDQTRSLLEGLEAGRSPQAALAAREREPDAPNYTPRISGMLDLSGEAPTVFLSLLKANRIDPSGTDRYAYCPSPPVPGFGYGLTTYMGDGDPLPSFKGDPLLLPLEEDAEATLERYWGALDAENRIALAVKEIARSGGASRLLVRNRREQREK